MADLSILIISHNKPLFVKEAIQCVLDQTHPNWEATLMDSGILLNQGFFAYLKDPRLKVIPTGETPEFARTRNMASWCLNQWLNSDRARGELIMYLCDDDLLYPEAFETYWNFYCQNDRVPQAMYASQDIGVVDPQGRNQIIGRRVRTGQGAGFARAGGWIATWTACSFVTPRSSWRNSVKSTRPRSSTPKTSATLIMPMASSWNSSAP